MQKIWKRLLCLCALAHGLEALPKGMDVASGEVFFFEDAGGMQIQASDHAIINYSDFSIALREKVQFIQPSKDATVLNRVTSSNPSNILGNLSSNGKIFLVNPNGVYFGADSQVDTGSLIVSTLGILDQDFLEERYSFQSKGTNASIHNEGTLVARDGSIALLSPEIKNDGIIQAALDKVVLLSGELITLTFGGDHLMSFEVEKDLQDCFVEHVGQMEARQVFLQVGIAKKAIDGVINTEGLVTADTLIKENGKVRIAKESSIKARDAFIEASDVSLEGKIDVASDNLGGTLHVLGDTLSLSGAQIDASGLFGGGTVLIGGEYKGSKGIRTALTTLVDEHTFINANAIQEGDGGRVIVWADGTTLFNGEIEARGGETAGSGGFVETSGKENLYVGLGRVNTLSSHGSAGMWLLDPTTLTIVQGTGTTTLPLTCGDATTPTIGTTTINSAGSNVTLCASSSITQNAGASIAISTSGITLTFLGTGSTVTTLNDGVATTGADITFTSTAVVLGSAAAVVIDTTNAGGSAAGANISFDSSGTINGTAGTETLTLNGGTGGTVSFGAAVGGTTSFGSLTATGATITQSSTAVVTGAISYTGTTAINIQGAVTTKGGSATFTGPVALTNSFSIDMTNSAAVPVGGNIGFSSTLNGATDLSLNGGTTGNVTLTGAVGGGTPLTSLTVTALSIAQSSTVVTTGAISYTAPNIITLGGALSTNGNAISMTGPVSLTAGFTVSTAGVATGANISFSSTVNGAQALVLNAGTSGIITFGNSIGANAALTNLTFTNSAGIQIGGNIRVTGGNPITFGQAVTLTGSCFLTSTFGSVTTTFSSTVNGTVSGSQALSVTGGAGTCTFTGAIGGSVPLLSLAASGATVTQSSSVVTIGPVTYAGSTVINIRGFITTSGGNIVCTGPTVLTNAVTLDTTNGGAIPTGNGISFSAGLNGTSAFSALAGTAGNALFSGAIGASTALSSITVTAAVVTFSSTVTTTGALTCTGISSIIINNSVTAGAGISFIGVVTGSNNINTIAGTGTSITFSSAYDFSGGNTISAPNGTVTFNGPIGRSAAAGSVIVSANMVIQNSTARTTNILYTAAGGITLNGSITTTTSGGSLTLTGPVTLTNSVTIDTTNGGALAVGRTISFTSTINGAFPLTLISGTLGTIGLSGAVGAITPLTGLTLNGLGITQSSTVKTTGAISYTSGASGITFANNANITTSGNPISMTGAVSLGANLSMDTTNSGGTATGGDITFSTTVNGSCNLILNGGTTGSITKIGIIGGSTPPTSLTVTAGSINQVAAVTVTGALSYAAPLGINLGASITKTTTTGSFSFTGPMNLTNSASIDTTNAGAVAGASINFVNSTSTINGAQTLSLRAGSGTISLSGVIGGSVPLTSLTVVSAATLTQTLDVTTTGAVAYTATTINVQGGITTNGATVGFTGAVVVANSPTIDTTNGQIVPAGATISFSSTINGNANLTLQAGTGGTVAFPSAVGGTTTLGSLTVVASTVTQTSTMTVSGAVSYTGSTAVNIQGDITTSGGAISITGPITLTNSNVFTTTANSHPAGANITFSSPSTSANNAVGLTLVAGTAGIITFTGAGGFGGTTGPTSLTISSANTIQLGTVFTMPAAINFAVPVSLIGNSTVSSGGTNGNLTFSSTLNGAYTLTLVAGTGTVLFSGIVGGTTPLAGLTFTSASLIQIANSLSVSGLNALTFPFPVAITGTSTITTNNSNVTFSSTLVGPSALTIQAGTAGTVLFTGAVGGTALASLSVIGGTITQASTAATTGALSYIGTLGVNVQGNVSTSGGAITIAGTTLLTNSPTFDSTVGAATGGDITFSGTLDGANSSQAPMFQSGTAHSTSFASTVGGTSPLANLIFGTVNLVQIGADVTVTGANALNFSPAVTLLGASTITTNNANLSFGSTLNGAFDLTLVGGSGTTTFTGAIGGSTALATLTATSATITQSSSATVTGALSYTGSTAVNVGGNITTSGGAITMTAGTFSLTGGSIFTTTANSHPAGADITFSNTSTSTDNAFALTLNAGTGGNVIFLGPGNFGGTTGPTSLTFTGANTIEIGTNLTVAGAVTFPYPVSLLASSTVSSGNSNGNIEFQSTVNGAYVLTLAAGTGTVIFDQAVGGIVPLVNLVFSTAALIEIGNNITVNGTNPLVFPDPVSLIGNSTILSNNANVTFSSTLISSVSGASSLVVDAGTGTLLFSGAVGGTPLASLTANAATITQSSSAAAIGTITYTGSTAINIQGNVTTSGGMIQVAGPVALTNSPTFNSASGAATGANILFAGTLDGANTSQAPTFQSGTAHNVIFSEEVGGIMPLANLSFGVVDTIEIGANITVTGANTLDFTSPVNLIGTSTITSNNADVKFSDALDGTEILTIIGGIGTVTFDAAVGGTTALSSLAATGGSIAVTANVTTNGGTITLTGATLLTNNPTFDSTNAGAVTTGADISFVGTLNGGDATQSPIFEAGSVGNVIFGGAVGSVTPLVDVTYNSAASIEVGADYRLTGASPISFPFPVQITGTSTISSVNNTAAVTFDTTLDGPGSLTVNTSGSTSAVTFTGAVGSITPLASLSVIGSTLTQSSSVRTVGALTYTGSSILLQGSIATHGGAVEMIGPVTLSNAPLVDTTDSGSRATGADISFSTTVNGTTSLTLAAGSAGVVTFNGAVGGTTALTNLVFNSASLIEVGANIRVSGANPLIFSEPVSLTSNSTINSTSAAITFSSTLDGTHALILSGGSGTVTFEDVVGGENPLQSLTVSAANITQEAALVVGGALIYSNSGLLTVSGTITASSVVQNGGGTVLLEASIIAVVSIVFANPITFDASLVMVAAGPGGITLNTIEPTLDGVYDLGLSARAGTITATRLGSPTAYINVLTLTAKAINIGSIYANTVLQNGTETINSNITAPGAYLIFPNPTTVASGGPFTIDVSGGVSPGGAWFQSTLDGPGGLDFIIGTGNLRFDGAVGGITAMSSLEVESAQNVSFYSDFTGGSFSQIAGAGTTVIVGTMTTTTSSGISLSGTNFNITGSLITQSAGPITINNSGILTLTGSSTSNGVFSQTGSGSVYLGDTITATNTVAASSGASFTGPIVLLDDVTINTLAGGGDITFASTATVNGLENFSLIAGSGNIILDGAVGGITPLDAVSIYSGDAIDLAAITASSFKQVAGTGTTTIAGTMTTTGDAGIVLAGNAFSVSALIQTISKGSIFIENSGAFTLSTGGQMKAAGSVIRKGSGATSLSGNVTSR